MPTTFESQQLPMIIIIIIGNLQQNIQGSKPELSNVDQLGGKTRRAERSWSQENFSPRNFTPKHVKLIIVIMVTLIMVMLIMVMMIMVMLMA